MTPRDIAQALARQIEAVCQTLLPNGQRKGRDWIAGSVHGEPGESLKVCLDGGRVGRWADFANPDDHGDLLDLWAACRGVALPEAIRQAKEWLGIKDAPLRKPAQTYERPSPKLQDLPEKILAWFRDRGISRPTLEKFGVAWNGREIVFPSIRDGELVAVKYRGLPKRFRQEAGQEPCLFGWQAVPDSSRAVVICEGEIDALSFAEWNIPALSVPMGGGAGAKHSWIENEYDHLSRFDTVYLCMDMDAPGQEAAMDIADRLGPERCRIVDLPHKDANESLTAGVTRDTILKCLKSSVTLDPPEIASAADYEDEILTDDPDSHGILMPWKKTHGEFLMRPGETIVIAGINGHGKTEMAGNLLAGALQQNYRAMLASFEFKPKRSLARLVRQISGCEAASEPFKRHIIRGFDRSLWVYKPDHGPQNLMDVMGYARRRYNVRLFVVDNLAKCGMAEDDYPAQKVFVDNLAKFARDTDSTVILVCHMRKPQDERHQSGKMDVKGSGAITDMVDSVLTVWRNKPKEEARKSGKEDKAQEPDCFLAVRKQRNGEYEETYGLWFDPGSHQFLAGPDHTPRPFVQYSAAPVERTA